MFMQQNSFQFKKKKITMKNISFLYNMIQKKNTMRMRKDHPMFDFPLKM